MHAVTSLFFAVSYLETLATTFVCHMQGSDTVSISATRSDNTLMVVGLGEDLEDCSPPPSMTPQGMQRNGCSYLHKTH